MEHLAQRYLAARRAVLEAPFAAMNPSQRAAVLAPPVPMLSLAGAGSGKTTVLVNRITCFAVAPFTRTRAFPKA